MPNHNLGDTDDRSATAGSPYLSLMARHATMLRAFAANPRRFHGQEPKLQELPKEVWINRPVTEEVRLMMSNVV
jgi:hypothetical protein